MEQSNFWMLSLVVFLILGVALQWPLSIRIVVIVNSVLVLWQIAAYVWEVLRNE